MKDTKKEQENVSELFPERRGQMKTFPLLQPADKEIPLEVAEEAYKEYSRRYGTSQSLDRLKERGGFGAAEIAILLFDRIKRIQTQPTRTVRECRMVGDKEEA